MVTNNTKSEIQGQFGTAKASPCLAAGVEVCLSLISGSRTRMVPTKAETAHRLLEQLHPDRAFNRPQWTLNDDRQMTVIPCAGVERVDVWTDRLPEWRHHESVAFIEEVSDANVYSTASPMDTRQGESYNKRSPFILMTAELRSGTVVRLRIHLRSLPHEEAELTPLDRGLFLHHLLSGPAFFGWAAKGGIFLLNPVNIVRIALTPTPAEAPSGSLTVHYVNEWSE